MPTAPPTSYDEIPYTNKAFHLTHPDNLATVARLHGVKAAPPERCRVLELGCGHGGNLIPMAATLPDSRFVGLDLSSQQIASGQRAVAALGLNNIDLQARSILEVDDSCGEFDYVIAHGVYSWVPAEVREKILAICARHLAAAGVAYVSFNVYPGWHVRGMVRSMLGFHAGRFAEPRTRVRQARAVLDFLVQCAPDQGSAYARLLKEEAELVDKESDTYLFHEHLEDVNEPVYFHEFARQAAARGLHYLAEARPSAMRNNLPERTTRILDQIAPERLDREQYLDFLCDGTFRRSLLCRAAASARPEAMPQALRSLYITGHAAPTTPEPDVRSAAAVEFRSIDEKTSLSTNRPLVKAALLHLAAVWPRSLRLTELWEAAQLLGVQGDTLDQLAEVLLGLYRSNLVELSASASRFTVQLSERPVASALARLQAAAGEAWITSLRHRGVEPSESERLVLQHLDGQHDRAALCERLLAAVDAGALQVEHDGRPLDDREAIREVLAASLEPCLERLAARALLVA